MRKPKRPTKKELALNQTAPVQEPVNKPEPKPLQHILSKADAYKAMVEGKRITHFLWHASDYLYMDNMIIYDRDNTIITKKDFLTDIKTYPNSEWAVITEV